MGFDVVDGVRVVSLDMVATTALAGVLLMLGYFIRDKVSFFQKFCFPAPVIGGFLFATLTLILHLTGSLSFELTTSLQTPFMLAFFTTVGLGGSFALIKTGGKSMIIYLVACWSLAILQNVLGAGLATLLGIHPALGIMAGAVSLEGGHGAAATFGPEAEALGIQGAAAVALAAATFGLISGNLTGGPLARRLITKHHLKIETADSISGDYEEMVAQQQKEETVESREFLFTMAVIGILMVLGMLFADWIKSLEIPNFLLPGYVGAMFGAIILRNVNDKASIIKLNSKIIGLISDISIGMFLSMAMMSLKVWELADLAAPLLVILVIQVVALLLLCNFILFPLLGKDYDAAVICAGMMGHGLGATPNAVANMNAVCENFGVRSNKAFLIVPLCGAVLIDLVAIPCIGLFLGYFAGV